MEIRPIKTEADYQVALAQIADLMGAGPHTPAGERLDVLVTLVQAYEETHWRIAPPDPIEVIKRRLEEERISRRDLEWALGSRSRVSEILNRRRPLTVEMIRRLHQKLGIPAESLIRPTVRRVKKRRANAA
jgi:HTH-type transcriptional regulator / antitoxin HigA